MNILKNVSSLFFLCLTEKKKLLHLYAIFSWCVAYNPFK